MSSGAAFPPDPGLAERRRSELAALGAGFPARLTEVLDATGRDPAHPAAIVPAPAVAALVGLLAAGRGPAEVEAAWLAERRDAPTGHAAMTRDLLAAAAPGAPLHVTYWT